ncbi:hypothetical protein A9168_08365 [Macellibacteroides sp. HH-ZS]|nr:hypothetical protein A9168_08365 [Macellibacteroides sp. HH-ZS]
MPEKGKKSISEEYENLMLKSDLSFLKNPLIKTDWDMKNGMFIQFSTYTDSKVCTTSNGNINLLK